MKHIAIKTISRKKALKYLGIFFCVMLALTLLANTLYTLSIAQVETVSPVRTGLTRKLEAQATVTSDTETLLLVDPVLTGAGIFVDEILVGIGQSVAVGDPVIRLNMAQLEAALDNANTELTRLRLNDEQAGIPVTFESDGSLDAEKAEQDWADAAQDRAERLEAAQKAVERAQNALSAAREALESARRTLDELQAGHAPEEDIAAAQEAVTQAEAKVKECQDTLNAANQNLRDVQDSISEETEDEEYERAKLREQQRLQQQQRDANEERAEIDAQLRDLDIAAQKEKVELLGAVIQKGGILETDSAGVVTAVSVEAGAAVGTLAARIAPGGGQYALIACVARSVAKYFSAGDTASVSFPSGGLSDFEAPVTEIREVNDEDAQGEDTQDMVELVVHILSTQARLGAAAQIKLEKNTAAYECVIPVAALREDSKGKFVLVQREREDGGWGSKLYAERVAVEVVDQNDEYAAVQGSLGTYDRCIIRSNKSLEDGDSIQEVRQ
jgi:hypothetical protein